MSVFTGARNALLPALALWAVIIWAGWKLWEVVR